jgi:hypothetical protein
MNWPANAAVARINFGKGLKHLFGKFALDVIHSLHGFIRVQGQSPPDGPGIFMDSHVKIFTRPLIGAIPGSHHGMLQDRKLVGSFVRVIQQMIQKPAIDAAAI